MKLTKSLGIVVAVALLALLCSTAVGAGSGAVGITFYESSGGDSGGGASPGGSANASSSTRARDRNTDTASGGTDTGNPLSAIEDSTIPLDTVSILDPEVPLSALGDLPKTGGNGLIPSLLLAASGMFLLAGFTTPRPDPQHPLA